MMTDVPVRYGKATLTTPSPSALPDAKMADWLPWTSTWAFANGERSLLSNTWTFICTSVGTGRVGWEIQTSQNASQGET